MNRLNEHLRHDIEEQFELPDYTVTITVKRVRGIKVPCNDCQPASCPCIGWKAFEEGSVTRI